MSISSRKQRFEIAKNRKDSWKSTYKDAMRYGSPEREQFDESGTEKGQEKTNPDIIFDSTAQTSKDDLASALEAALVPAYIKWVGFEPGVDIPEEAHKEVMKQLDSIRTTMFNYIHASNFNIQVSEAFQDVVVGTGALILNEGNDENPLEFLCVPVNQLYLEEGPNGKVETVFRKYRMPIRNITPTWPDAVLGAELEKMLSEKPETEVDILESTIHDYDEQTYTYTVDVLGKYNVLEEVNESSPWIVFRFSVLPGEVWGRGALLRALPDVKTLNKTKELLLKSAALKMIPMFVVSDDGVINPHNIKIQPGGIIPSAPFGPGGNPIDALPVGGDLNLGQFIMSDMREDIKKIMYTDDLPDVSGSVRSPTELIMRQEKLSGRIGSSFNRMQHELVVSVVKRSLFILNKKGLLPVDLTDVKVGGKAISISIESPLAKAQKQEEMANNRRFVEEIQALVGPQLLPLFVNVDGYAEVLGKNLDVDEKLKADDEQRERAMQILQQLNAAQQPEGESSPGGDVPPAQ